MIVTTNWHFIFHKISHKWPYTQFFYEFFCSRQFSTIFIFRVCFFHSMIWLKLKILMLILDSKINSKKLNAVFRNEILMSFRSVSNYLKCSVRTLCRLYFARFFMAWNFLSWAILIVFLTRNFLHSRTSYFLFYISNEVVDLCSRVFFNRFERISIVSLNEFWWFFVSLWFCQFSLISFFVFLFRRTFSTILFRF